MTNSTVPTLKPLTLGQLLDRTMRLYRRDFLKIVGIIAIVQVPVTLWTLLSFRTSAALIEQIAIGVDMSPNELVGLFGQSGILTLVQTYLRIVGVAALTVGVAGAYLGESWTIGSAFQAVRARIGRITVVFFLFVLLMIGVIIWTIIPCVGWLSGPGVLIFAAGVIFPLIVPVLMLEEHGAQATIRRAWDLARLRFWWLLGFVFVLTLLIQAIQFGPSALLQGALLPTSIENIDSLLGGSGAGFTWITIVSTLVQLVITLLVLPVQWIAMTLVYFDLRVRYEGLDLAFENAQTLTDSAEINDLKAAQSPLAIVASAPTSATIQLVSGREFGSFVGITVLILGVYAALVAVVVGILAIGFGL